MGRRRDRARGQSRDRRGDRRDLQPRIRLRPAGPAQLLPKRARPGEDAGHAFARHGRADQADPLLDRAAGLYQRLGAVRDLARADAALRAAGARRGRRRGTRDRPRFGWASLTPTEYSVAGLVAEGLSNPQIGARMYISSRTVQTHLAHIFPKLDISARAQLAAEVTQHQR